MRWASIDSSAVGLIGGGQMPMPGEGSLFGRPCLVRDAPSTFHIQPQSANPQKSMAC
jgi:hypothetical protein